MKKTMTTLIKQPKLEAVNSLVKKQYAFNQTGNILLTWIGDDVNGIPDDTKTVFSNVNTLFIDLLQKITNTINPKTDKRYSIYNYDGIMSVVKNSNAFLNVNTENINHKANTFGSKYRDDLLVEILGLDSLVPTNFPFAKGLFDSINNEALKMTSETNGTDNRLGTVFFVCEYLLGVTTITAVIVSCEVKLNLENFKLKPCEKKSAVSSILKYHKDTYVLASTKL